MFNFKTIFFIVSLLFVNPIYSQVELNPDLFANPPDSAKPMTWMHIMNGNISKEGLTKDLQLLSDAGVGGALVFSVKTAIVIPQGTITFNSQEWRDMLVHGVKESDRLGLKFGIHNCDGWSSSGGPWVTLEESMKKLVWSETVVSGGPVSVELPEPVSSDGFYRDIAVIAYPASQKEFDATNNRLTISCSAGENGVASICDSDLKTKSNVTWIQFEYEKPFPARSIYVEQQARPDMKPTLLTSNDGKTYRKVVDLHSGSPIATYVRAYDASFPEVNERFFRIEFEKPSEVSYVSLVPYGRAPGWMGLSAMDGSHDDLTKAKIDGNEFIPLKKILVLNSDSVLSDNQFRKKLPSGIWRIMRFGYTTTGAQNGPATDAGTGLECDKLNAKALDKHFAAYVGKVAEESGSLAGKSFRFAEIDSYERGYQNWTDGFGEIFKKKKGYDLLPFLPLMAGQLIENTNTSDAVYADFYGFVTSLMKENYYHRFQQLCNQYGMISYVEPYGDGPINSLDAGGVCDIPMGEFWMNGRYNVDAAVSAAHTYGKPVVSAESFTSVETPNWKGHPFEFKIFGDKAWALGINEFMFHRYAHQANTNVVPGMTMAQIGSNIDGTQTWWLNAGKAWMKYIQRGSYILRQGIPVSDVLVYVGEKSRQEIPSRQEIGLPNGYNFDRCNTEVLINRIQVQNSKLVLPEGTTYSMLMLYNCDQLSVRTLKRLGELAKAGVKIIGLKPVAPLGYLERTNQRDNFSSLVNQIWQRKNIIEVSSWTDATQITPDLTVEEVPNLDFIHRKIGEDDLYFVHNIETEAKTFHCSFRVTDRIPELWYADTGKREQLTQFTQANGRTNFAIELDPAGSVFVVFRASTQNFDPVNKITPSSARVLLSNDGNMELLAYKPGEYTVDFKSGKQKRINVPAFDKPISLDSDWRVEFDGLGIQKPNVLDFKTLTDWKDFSRNDIRYFSGTAIYRKKIDIPASYLNNETRVILDLGQVEIAAEVFVNQKPAGIAWKPPYVLNVTDLLKSGANEIEIRVTNLWSNRLIGDEQFEDNSGYAIGKPMPKWYSDNKPMPKSQRVTFTTYNFYKKDHTLLSSGLLGPVLLKSEAKIHVK